MLLLFERFGARKVAGNRVADFNHLARFQPVTGRQRYHPNAAQIFRDECTIISFFGDDPTSQKLKLPIRTTA